MGSKVVVVSRVVAGCGGGGYFGPKRSCATLEERRGIRLFRKCGLGEN